MIPNRNVVVLENSFCYFDNKIFRQLIYSVNVRRFGIKTM